MSIPSSYSAGSIGGGTSPSGDVKFAYLGFTQTKNSYQLITQETYQGTKQKLQSERDNNPTWQINYEHSEYGKLQSVVINQEAGPFYKATKNFNKVLNNGISIHTDSKNLPQQTNLDVGMFSMPIQKCKNYDYRWNHGLIVTNPDIVTDYLIGKGWPWMLQHNDGTWTLENDSQFTTQMANIMMRDLANKKYHPSLDIQWVLDLNERNKDPLNYYTVDDQGFVTGLSGMAWQVYFYPIKPGINYFDLPTYTITETGRYESRNNCQWAILNGGKLAYPISGDFGIQKYYHPDNLTCQLSDLKGYWLCQGGQIDYDGKYYNANCRYTWSPDPDGWDLEMYDFYKSRSQYQTKSIRNPNPLLTGHI